MRTRDELPLFSPRQALGEARRYWLSGIGGAGMSGIARMMLARGLEVAGSDAVDSPILAKLREAGAAVSVGEDPGGLRPGDAVVVTDAVDLGASAEVARARELGLPLFRRSQALGWLLEGKRTVAVTGTHGKSTTAAMAGMALRSAGLDPLVVVGAEVPQLGGAVAEGAGAWAVVEACEAYDGLHDLDAEVAVLTNLELDHVDFHGSWERLLASVRRFLEKAAARGAVLYNRDDPGATEAVEGLPGAVGFSASDWAGPELAAPGLHNRANAAGALAAARFAGADEGEAAAGIAAFSGVARRLQVLDESGPVVVDDYAHHPTEIAASIEALRERYPGRRLVVAFQPHLYSRTKGLIREFASALSLADFVFVTDIYPAREAPIPGVSSVRIVEALACPCRYVPSRRLLPRAVAAACLPGDVVVGMGAGNIEEFAPELLAEARRGRARPRVAVACGGDASEREVSLLSGLAVVRALEEAGYDAFALDLSDRLLAGKALGELVGPARPDAVFLAVHGQRAEDGAVQGLLEMLHLPYTGSGIAASALAMDKHRAKEAFARAGLRVPAGGVFRSGAGPEEVARAVPSATGWVVKPNQEGSTVGLSFVTEPSGLARALEAAFGYDELALVEERVVGVEISVPVLLGRALPAVEIQPRSGVYDFESKYVPGATDEPCPARLPEETALKAAEAALRAHECLGCRGVTRTDMIVVEGEPVVLELNTLPGLTPTSLVPRSAAAAGIGMAELCRALVEEALGGKA